MTLRSSRVSVNGPVELAITLTPDQVASFAEQRLGELVRPLPATPADAAAGRRRYEVIVDGWRFEAVVEAAGRAALRERAARAPDEQGETARMTLRAQIPGRVARVWVADGEQVAQGQRLLAIEAMKMENEIRAPRAGTIDGLRVAVGDRVEREDELLSVS